MRMGENEDTLVAIVRRHQLTEGPLLPILHDVQHQFGHVSEQAVRTIADMLNLTRAEVSGVVSFYHDFRRHSDPRPSLRLCRAESCQARGSEALAQKAEAMAGDRVRVETVYCLGLCSVGPNAMVDDAVHARLDDAKLSRLIEAL